ncbi:MAG: hypothetical protein GXP06_09610 [Alphaproteobacteria bacterium]|nr:hypothetical protein [Alphaproteobacteria bacterium]
MTFITRLIRSAAMLVAATTIITAPPAAAQIGGIVNQAKKRAEREARDAAETAVAKAIFPLEQDSADLRRMSFFMDRYTPLSYGDNSALERTSTGGYKLQPGSYKFHQQSYCLKAGTYGKPGGNGYMTGKLSGKLGPYLRTILANSYQHSDIPRNDIQWLIWGIISGVNTTDMKPNVQHAAAELLSPSQIAALNGLDAFVPAQLSSRAMRKMPRAVRKSYEAHQRMRRAAARPDVSFEDLERIAVLDGVAPSTDNDVPKNRWSWHPDGYFIRFDSTGYSRSITEIVVPEQATVIRDAIGRITEMRFANGDYSIVTYASDEPITSRKFRKMAAFPIARVEIHSRNLATGEMRVAAVDDKGHIFLSERSLRHAAITPRFRTASMVPAIPAMSLWQSPIRVIDLEAIQEARENAEYIQERIDRATRPPGPEDIDDFLDMGHYSDGIEAAFGGPAAGFEWLIDHYERQNRALAYATVLIEGLGEDAPDEPSSGIPPMWDPSAEAALPTSESYAQMLGLSGSTY